MKEFLDNRRNKKIERNVSNKRKEEQNFRQKLLKKMEQQDKFNEMMVGFQQNMTQLTQTMSNALLMMAQALNQNQCAPPTMPFFSNQEFFSSSPNVTPPILQQSIFTRFEQSNKNSFENNNLSSNKTNENVTENGKT